MLGSRRSKTTAGPHPETEGKQRSEPRFRSEAETISRRFCFRKSFAFSSSPSPPICSSVYLLCQINSRLFHDFLHRIFHAEASVQCLGSDLQNGLFDNGVAAAGCLCGVYDAAETLIMLFCHPQDFQMEGCSVLASYGNAGVRLSLIGVDFLLFKGRHIHRQPSR